MLVAGLAATASGSPLADSPPDGAAAGRWIADMKSSARGPFRRIRWFCEDGAVLPPKPHACAQHGGGRQHGEWNETTLDLRAAGFLVGNVLAAVDIDAVLDDRRLVGELESILLEQFLVLADDGWILRRAQHYRGAFQAEAELNAATRLLLGMLGREDWLAGRVALIFEGARLLAHDGGPVIAADVRLLATQIHRLDPGFADLRNKIHGKPDSGDAERVRSYAATMGVAGIADQYESLARSIEQASQPATIDALGQLAVRATDARLAATLERNAGALNRAADAAARLEIISKLSVALRDGLAGFTESTDRLLVVDAILLLERAAFRSTQSLRQRLANASRAERLQWIGYSADCLYALGLVTAAERNELRRSLAAAANTELSLDRYRATLDVLGRVPAWAHRRLALHLSPTIERWRVLDEAVLDYIPDRLRRSPALFLASTLESLNRDTGRISGLGHKVFGDSVAGGLRSLNPGIARGTLRTPESYAAGGADPADTILLVPETLPDLPPVAGLLTEHEGNQLSHVQLLARNLGIPNIVISSENLEAFHSRIGQRIFIAASAGGVVRIDRYRPEHDRHFGQQDQDPAARIVIDTSKLDLGVTSPIPLDELRAVSSGVVVGPKAAQLGELHARFPGTVSPGIAIPFGAFRQVLDRPAQFEGMSAFEWLREQYRSLREIDDRQQRLERRNTMLARFRHWLLQVEFDEEFRTSLAEQASTIFGDDGSYGVFVRSDTNVEDLPGFTGAGLNLTVPNVVGLGNIEDAIRKVWASPFTERAFAWRQALMDRPEHVYPAVLLHQSVNSEKSGVLVTTGLNPGQSHLVTVVVNEGVGGGVDGQSAETLVIDPDSGRVRLLFSATAPAKRVLPETGGSELRRTSGRERVLTQQDIRALIRLVDKLPDWFGKSDVVADVEFGFADNRLVLFQIRPFVDNNAARNHAYLSDLDATLEKNGDIVIALADPTVGEK